MLPRVIVHNMVSVDGRTDWFELDEEQLDETVANWSADCTLAGSGSLLAANPQVGEEESPVPIEPIREGDDRPLLAVVDSRGTVKGWSLLRDLPGYRGVVALCSEVTPREHVEMLRARAVPHIVTGIDHVYLRDALEQLHDAYGVRVVRVDSGGTLSGLLLRSGLVSVVSVLVHPSLVGGLSPTSLFRAPDLRNGTGVIELRLVGVERLKSDVVWLRYLVVK